MKTVKISEIVGFLEKQKLPYDFKGDLQLEIHDFSNSRELRDYSLSWVKNTSYLTSEVKEGIASHQGILLVCPMDIEGASCIITENPKQVFFSILNEFFPTPRFTGISSHAEVLAKKVGRNVSIGAHCYIGEDVEIADDVTIHHNVVIECPCRIGRGTEIFSGVVIGTEGFGYYKNGDVPVHETHYCGVVIGEYVEIGANTCIDRGLLTDTVIGNHVKIDNLCHIAHNDRIGDNVQMTAGSVLCGSVTIEKNAYLAPGSIVLNQKTIGEHAYVGIGSVVIGDVRPDKMVFGIPARILRENDE